MWELLLLPLGLGAALGTPGAGGPAGGCQHCRSPHGGLAVANATRGSSVTLRCPAAGAALGRLVAVRWWHLGGDPAVPAVPVCARGRGPPRCHPPYGARAALVAPGVTAGVTPDVTLGVAAGVAPVSLELRDVRGGDSGTFTCLLVGDSDCACGTVTLRVAPGAPCSPPCSGAPPRGGRGSVTIVTAIVTVTVTAIVTGVLPLPPARGH